MMRSLRWGALGLLGSTWLCLAGCGSSPSGPAQRPIDSPEATTTTNQRVDELIVGLANSVAGLDVAGSTTVATESVDSVLGGSSACPGSSAGSGTVSGATDDVPQSTNKDLEDVLRDLAREAKEHVFREEFVESKDGNQVVYKIDPASACGTDSTCVQKLTANPIRFAVTANEDDTLNVSLLVGQARYNPATVSLGPTKLSVRVDLAETLATIRLFVDAQDQADLPERLDGVVGGAIEKRSTGEFAVSGSVFEKFDLLVGQAKGKPVAVTVQPSDPTTLLTINPATNTIGYALDLGAVDVHLAGAAVCDDPCGSKEKTGTFSGHLGGVTGGVALSKGATDLTLTGLGLGNDTSYLALDNDRLGTLDVNPNNGRKLTVNFKKTAEGTLVTFDPALDIKLAFMLSKLSESMRVDMPDWLSNEVFDVMLGGAPKPSVLVPAPTCDANGNSTSKGQLKVVTGDLRLSSSSLASPVDVPAGMCLLPVDGADSDANPVSQVKAGVCQ
jgi:hypothetical protein